MAADLRPPARAGEGASDLERHRELARAAIQAIAPYPAGRFAGRGIVICAGGRRYFTCAWVCVRMLRHLGCRLPIELWYLGPYEMTAEMAALLAPLDVRCVDARAVQEEHPARRLGGWELKPYAILHTRFEEVIFLDADNVPLIDPERLFETAEYHRHGAIFWPDFHPLDRTSPIWDVAEVPHRYEPSFESGQIVVDKRRCFAPLQLAMHYNEHSDYYYQLLAGDKDTFHIAWRRLLCEYAMVPWDVRALGDRVMCQHDFDGERIFQHRNNAKWMLPAADNPRIDGFREEPRCLSWLAELEERWSGRIAHPVPESSAARRLEADVIAVGRFLYHRVGHDRRVMQLRPDHSIGEGGAGFEVTWQIEDDPEGEPILVIAGSMSKTCTLARRPDGVYAGRWLIFERMPIELIPISHVPVEDLREIERVARRGALVDRQALLVRVRMGRQVVRLKADGRIAGLPAGGSGGRREARWELVADRDRFLLELSEADERYHVLVEEPDGVWREQIGSDRGRLELIPLAGCDCR
jgi:putative mannosyltransferase